jgi:hypothetical protein
MGNRGSEREHYEVSQALTDQHLAEALAERVEDGMAQR